MTTLMHIKGWFKFLNWGDSKDTVKSLFNRPKIISCQKWTIRVRIWVMATSERSKLLNRRPNIISCQKLTIRVRISVLATSERFKLLNRRPKIVSCRKLTIVVLVVYF